MKTNGNGKQDKPGGWYQLDDDERDFLIASINRTPVAGEENLQKVLALLDKLRNKHVAPEHVYSSTDEVVALDDARSKT